MADEERALEAYQQFAQQVTQRFTQVEADVKIVTHETTQIRSVLERQTSILDTIVKQLNLDEQITVAIRERTDQHAKTIEHLQSNEVDNSKILNRHDNEIATLQGDWKKFTSTLMSVIKWFLVTIGSLILGAIAAHFIH